jgi:hypothetical protein
VFFITNKFSKVKNIHPIIIIFLEYVEEQKIISNSFAQIAQKCPVANEAVNLAMLAEYLSQDIGTGTSYHLLA